MATSMLLKLLTLKWNISRTIWRIEVGDGSLFCICHALSFEFNFYFDRRFPLKASQNLMFFFTKGTQGQSIPSKIAVREQFVQFQKGTIKYLVALGKFREKEQFVLSRVE